MWRTIVGVVLIAGSLLGISACSGSAAGSAGAKVTLVLNWRPEPEFGGFYAAQNEGTFKAHRLTVDIVPGGAGAPAIDLVASGKAEFGIASADEVVIGQDRGKDVVALFAVYQTCPQGIMVHADSGLTSIGEVLHAVQAGKLTLAMEKGLPYARFLAHKYKLNLDQLPGVVGYDGSTAVYLSKRDYAQQCFITSEPLAVKEKGQPARVFLISEEGYNPYTAVVIARRGYVDENPGIVRAFVESIRQGWQSYLKDPHPTDVVMAKLNPLMNLATFDAVAAVQKPLIEDTFTAEHGLGAMSDERWLDLVRQLKTLGLINRAPTPHECYVDAENPWK